MSSPASLFAVLLAVTLLAAEDSRGEAPRKAPDLTYNAYYETLVIPMPAEVANELRLSEPQKTFATKQDRLPPPEAKGAGYWDERKKRKAEFLKMLNNEQRQRLTQLTFQYQGALASFNLPDVATSLNISPEQKQKLASVQYLLRSGSDNLKAYETQLYPQDPNRGRFLAQLRRSCDCVAESVLSPAQMLKWRSLQGKPMIPRPAGWD